MDLLRDQVNSLLSEGSSPTQISEALGIDESIVHTVTGDLSEQDLPAIQAGLKDLALGEDAKRSPFVRFQALRYLHDEIKGRNDREKGANIVINLGMLEERVRAAKQARAEIGV